MLSLFETDKVFIAKGLNSASYYRAANSLVTALENQHVEWG